jgi:hypothetical protein
MLEQVVRYLVRYHEVLRLRAVQDDAYPMGVREFIVDPDQDDTQYVLYRDWSALSDEEQQQNLQALRDGQWASLDLAHGPTLRFILVELGLPKPPCLLVVIHHFVGDGYSLPILMEDFEVACQQMIQGKEIGLSPKTVSLKEWAEQMHEYICSDQVKPEMEYWHSLPRLSIEIPVDYSPVPVYDAARGVVSASLNAEETRILFRQVPSVYDVTVMDVLLTGLAVAFQRSLAMEALLVRVMASNRDQWRHLDLSRVLGFIAGTHWEFLALGGAVDVESALRLVHQQRSCIPNGGANWPWLEAHRRKEFQFIEEYESRGHVMYNYTGQQQTYTGGWRQLYLPQPQESGIKKENKLYFSCRSFVADNQFTIVWKYFAEYHKQITVERLAQEYLIALRSLID